MNRRSIFKLLAGAACAAAIEITGLMPMLPKAAKYKVNPEYLSATYEDVAIMTELVDGKNELLVIRVAVNCVEELPIILPISNGAKIISDHNRNRFNRLPSGELQQVPRFVLDS